jgi:hypothetical protein
MTRRDGWEMLVRGESRGGEEGTYHSLDCPYRVGVFGLGGDAVVDGVPAVGSGSTADEDTEVGGVWSVLREKNHGSL